MLRGYQFSLAKHLECADKTAKKFLVWVLSNYTGPLDLHLLGENIICLPHTNNTCFVIMICGLSMINN
jgi:hypothetical protein